MIYRPVGKTDISASIIGLGSEHLDGKPYETVDDVISTAMEHGINSMDLFMPGEEVRGNIGRALKGRRDKMHIQGHICSTGVNKQYDISRDYKTIKKYFENLLRCLGTDYIDFGMLFFVDSDKGYADTFEGDPLKYALELKQQGVIRALGASSHNPRIARRVVETGLVDLIMFSINPAFDLAPSNINVIEYLDKKALDYEKSMDPERAGLYRLCEQKGVGITVMKALGAGKLLSPERTPFAKALTVPQCIHYALTRPAVASVHVGYTNRNEVLEALRYLDADDAEKDYSAVIDKYQGNFKGSCVYCNHCLPCPAGINIADVNKYLDIATLDEKNIPPGVQSHYRSLEKHGSDCIACGNCEQHCPFSVSIIKNMKKATSLFGF